MFDRMYGSPGLSTQTDYAEGITCSETIPNLTGIVARNTSHWVRDVWPIVERAPLCSDEHSVTLPVQRLWSALSCPFECSDLTSQGRLRTDLDC